MEGDRSRWRSAVRLVGDAVAGEVDERARTHAKQISAAIPESTRPATAEDRLVASPLVERWSPTQARTRPTGQMPQAMTPTTGMSENPAAMMPSTSPAVPMPLRLTRCTCTSGCGYRYAGIGMEGYAGMGGYPGTCMDGYPFAGGYGSAGAGRYGVACPGGSGWGVVTSPHSRQVKPVLRQWGTGAAGGRGDVVARAEPEQRPGPELQSTSSTRDRRRTGEVGDSGSSCRTGGLPAGCCGPTRLGEEAARWQRR